MSLSTYPRSPPIGIPEARRVRVKFSNGDNSCLINRAVVSPSSVGFVAIITSLKFPFSILSFSSFSLNQPGPIPLIGFIAPPRT